MNTPVVTATFLDIAHAEAIAEENRRNIKAVDQLFAPKRGSYGTGAPRADKVKRAPTTLHDLAASDNNEFLRMLLRKAQLEGRM
jgi:hypothetical protein